MHSSAGGQSGNIRLFRPLINNGTIAADASGKTITISSTGPLTNNGTLQSTNSGTLAVTTTTVINTGTLDASGQQEGLAPRVSGTLYGQYRRPLDSGSAWFVRSDITYVGNRYDSILNKAFTGPTTKVNLKLGMDVGHLNVTAFANNLFDDRHVESASYQSDSATDPFSFLPASTEIVLPRKRQVGVTMSYNF